MNPFASPPIKAPLRVRAKIILHFRRSDLGRIGSSEGLKPQEQRAILRPKRQLDRTENRAKMARSRDE